MNDKEIFDGFRDKVFKLGKARENFWSLAKSVRAGAWSGQGVRINEEARVVAALEAHPLGLALHSEYCHMIAFRNELMKDLQPVVRRLARSFAEKYGLPGAEEDLVQEGNIGILQWTAHVTLDKAGAEYSAFTYARRWITQAMTRWIKEQKLIAAKAVSIWCDESNEACGSLLDQIPSEDDSPEKTTTSNQKVDKFLASMRKNPEYQDVATMFLNGLSDTEIAVEKPHMSLNLIRKICSDTKSASLLRTQKHVAQSGIL